VGHQEEVVDEVLKKAESFGYVDDHALAEILLSECNLRGKGPLWLEQKLHHRKLQRPVIEVVVALALQSAKKNAQKVLNRHYPGSIGSDEKPRAYRRLISRGFPPELVEETIEESLRQEL